MTIAQDCGGDIAVEPAPETGRHSELVAEMDWVQRLARRLLGGNPGAEDASQEALTLALASAGGRPRRGRTLRAFLATTTRRVVRDERRAERRRQRRQAEVARPEAGESTLEGLEQASCAQALARAVEALDEPYRSTVRLRYLEQCSVAVIAERLAISPATVRKRLSRGLAMLRARLGADWRERNAAFGVLPLGTRWVHQRTAAVLAAGLLGGWFLLDRVAPEPAGDGRGSAPRIAALVAPTFSGGDGKAARTALVLAAQPSSPGDSRADAEGPGTTMPPLAASLPKGDPGDYALLAAAFATLHQVSRLGEEVCRSAQEQQQLDCAVCHGPDRLGSEELPDEGFVRLVFDDGSPRAEGQVLHGKRSGSWTEWYPGGILAGRGEYFDGDRNGPWELYTPAGDLRARGEYLYGKREGEWIEYDSSGAVVERSSWRAGKRHGWTRRFVPGTALLSSEVQWYAGEREGLARTFHADGSLAGEGRYRRDIPVPGSWRFWDARGALVASRIETIE